jgi:ADP-dependent NAD(P)H-hydrate dehydratase
MTDAIAITRNTLRGMPLPLLNELGDKNDRGRLLIVAGGAQVPGAPILVGLAGLRAGAGKLQLAATAEVATSLGLSVPEARVLRVPATAEGEIAAGAGDALRNIVAQNDAIVIGPGMVDEAVAGELAVEILRQKPNAVVLDAAALTGTRLHTAALTFATAHVVITPHHGELAKLMSWSIDDVRGHPAYYARRTAEHHGVVVILKGAETNIAVPRGAVFCHQGGVPGLGTSGSGDVLAGIVGGLLARGADPKVAAVWGVSVHAWIGRHLTQEIGPVGFLARDLVAKVPLALETLTRSEVGDQ